MTGATADYATYITYAVLILIFATAVWFIIKKGKQNIADAKDDAAPKIAGEDDIGGAAQNPEQFAEPDDDALDEMGALLGEDEEELKA
nr:hypothetical protein [Euryarchaeota archaeon]